MNANRVGNITHYILKMPHRQSPSVVRLHPWGMPLPCLHAFQPFSDLLHEKDDSRKKR
jgi:hypothetical protein